MASVLALRTSMAVGDGWLVLVQSLQGYNVFFCSSSQRVVSLVLYFPLEAHVGFPICLARILIRRGNMDEAHVVMSRIYALARPEEVELKVCTALHCSI